MLKYIYRIQALEAAEKAIIAEKKNSMEYKDLRLIKRAFDQKKQQFLRLSQDLEQLNQRLSEFPHQQKLLADKLENEKKSLYDGSVINVKAMSARESQIRSLEEQIIEIESLMSTCHAELKKKESASEQLKAELEDQYVLFRDIKTNYQQKEAVRQQKLDELAAEKVELVQYIDQSTLAWYEADKDRMNGSPVAVLNENHVCGGCHTMVTPIAFKRTQQKQKVICENCGRLLFIYEE